MLLQNRLLANLIPNRDTLIIHRLEWHCVSAWGCVRLTPSLSFALSAIIDQSKNYASSICYHFLSSNSPSLSSSLALPCTLLSPFLAVLSECMQTACTTIRIELCSEFSGVSSHRRKQARGREGKGFLFQTHFIYLLIRLLSLSVHFLRLNEIVKARCIASLQCQCQTFCSESLNWMHQKRVRK